ncbi:MAG: hypothetical protein B6243_05370 [Anaerolineaceae bacterium 4572_5.2]|nr:MAG: hypothetical protein B6243_05370 [Anaerolineaceae bacterium 4572_5.2]
MHFTLPPLLSKEWEALWKSNYLMRWIYISPHLDDAIFSAGGLIYEQTQTSVPVEIWTIMSGFPNDAELTKFAKSLHKRWGTSSAEETIRIRRAEDERAADIVGAKTRHFNFLDCMYRRGPNGEALYNNSFAQLHTTEMDLPKQIANAISKHLQPEDILVCQLALGGHLDHIVVRKAAKLLERSLFYSADFPYLLNTKPQKLWWKTIGLKEFDQSISETGLLSWLEAARAYASQIGVTFKTTELMQEKLTAYWMKRKGIRIWKTR